MVHFSVAKYIRLRNRVIEYLNTSNEDRETQVREVAKLARKELELRNDNLMFLVEKSGVFIFEKAIGEDIDAYSLWTKEERPFIILGNLKR